jgi:hypothetical protein
MRVAPASARASEMLLPNMGPAPPDTNAILPLRENLSRMPMVTHHFPSDGVRSCRTRSR